MPLNLNIGVEATITKKLSDIDIFCFLKSRGWMRKIRKLIFQTSFASHFYSFQHLAEGETAD
ncbi:MAG: hypothetical protein A2750_00510 [Candidatus Yanofskybacteria bacterium RIFCSPHIGHO2_01_FULL_45_42]|uniref:Uncharacterized protein n=1 Tax=Candidatus Yanofskybacteria bacterium RIFCSPHIGHO2_01_FULL_45_42 TaxID=1802671 RepID=A0A1F8F574_9BACT|nr:MAG: hypothetical protein A2750_00510 [Candidatus Yanofskybacteria bacterium RIFCSPHIGHO2_01_FULL_45_42]